jgi:hypothetical protein
VCVAGGRLTARDGAFPTRGRMDELLSELQGNMRVICRGHTHSEDSEDSEEVGFSRAPARCRRSSSLCQTR